MPAMDKFSSSHNPPTRAVSSVGAVPEPAPDPLRRTYRRLRSGTLALLRLRPSILIPKLGMLRQHPPRKLRIARLPSLAPGTGLLPSMSIVTPSFEQGRFLRQSLDSVLDQEHPCLEYFVQDGGSTDESAAILSDYDGRLNGWETAPDRGKAHAINVAFRRTSGEIMGWLNSDDLLMPGALMYVARFFACNPRISVLYGNRILIDEGGLEVGRWILPEHDSDILRWVDFIPQETLFWRRSLWDAVGGGLDESLQFAIDWDLLLRFQDAGARFAHVPHFLGAFRVHPQQKTSAQIDSLGAKEVAALRRKYLGFEPSENEVMKRTKSYLSRHLIEHARVHIRDWIAF
jgi:glycosyltransferase involved in cell wall biosynthesis